MPVNLECVRSVDAGSLLNLLGQGQKELAQEKDVGGTPGEPGTEGHRVVSVDQLQLTPGEAEKFWPIYREFAERRRGIRQEMREARNANPGQTDQEAVDQQFKMKQQELDLEKDYSGRLLKVISAQKLRSLPQAERKFRQMILDQIQRRQMQQERLRDRNQQQLQKRNN